MRDHASYESPGVASGPVLWIALAFLAFVGLSTLALLAYFHFAVKHTPAIPPTGFPSPQLQATAVGDLHALQERQLAQLRGYAWIDRDHGIARIPIEDAMAVLASRGPHALDPPNHGAEGSP